MTFDPDKKKLQEWFTKLTSFSSNDFHPLVWIMGQPSIGKNVYLGGFSEVNANGVNIMIGDNCDIAAGTIVGPIDIPPYTLVVGNPANVKSGYYLKKNDIA